MKSDFHHSVTVQRKPPEKPLREVCFAAHARVKLLLKLVDIFANHHHLSQLLSFLPQLLFLLNDSAV